MLILSTLSKKYLTHITMQILFIKMHILKFWKVGKARVVRYNDANDDDDDDDDDQNIYLQNEYL